MLEQFEDSIGHCSNNGSFYYHYVSGLNWSIGPFALSQLVEADLGYGLLSVGSGAQ